MSDMKCSPSVRYNWTAVFYRKM